MWRYLVAAAWCVFGSAMPGVSADEVTAPLPGGVRAVWDLDKAHRETTTTQSRVCLNGLWRWQPASADAKLVPENGWGFFKVPGCWPGITNYMQKDAQTLYAHPAWKSERISRVTTAWYQREVTIPEKWDVRRIDLCVECLNSYAVVYMDGKRAGELRFPGGELDLTPFCHAGRTHGLSMLVAARPLAEVLLAFNDTNQTRRVRGTVARRGLCGDVFLLATPTGPRIADVKVETSVRQRSITFGAALERLPANVTVSLRANVTADGKSVREFESQPFEANNLQAGRFAFSASWMPDRLWDLHTPHHTYDVQLSLEDAGGNVLDESLKTRFGFREFWIDGRDFHLNGTRIHLSAVPLDNAQVSAASAAYDGARESLLRLKSFGINFVYTHNYGCEPGTHLSFGEILQAADDVGMLVAFSQPHFGQYPWDTPDADDKNGYAAHAESYVRIAQNHPAVVAYSMSHNACGYSEDMNPDMIDGLKEPRSTRYELRNSGRARRAEAIVRRLDPSRIVYHHSSGNLGSMHTMNFYPNFVPIQEMSDWFGHWATEGVKPAFMCEYGAPFSWDWAMYRGWYEGERSFGSARVPWEFCLAEWNAQFLGDRAFQISDQEKANLRWEARRFRTGRRWNRWDYPFNLGSSVFDERYVIRARYITDNWRAFRTWGVSAISPWEHGQFWRLRDGVDRGRKDLAVDWDRLQRPGFSPDYIEQRYERMDLAYERANWEPTGAATALLRNNRPLLAYIAGRPEAFTSKDHIFNPGDAFEKQAVVINNSRQGVQCECAWRLDLSPVVAGGKQVTVAAGDQVRIPLDFHLSMEVAPGTYDLHASFKFSTGELQDDSFAIHVMPTSPAPKVDAKIALFDPQGETANLLAKSGVRYQMVRPGTDLSGYDTLIVGKAALTPDGETFDISRVGDGLRVILFEQTSEVLEKRFGLRVIEYGLRQVFARVPDHPILAGMNAEHLRDWRGEATLLPPKLDYRMRPRHGPTVDWCDIPVSRLWRCGNRGNVASVLIEKPARGDFLPIVDGGFSLQYSPLIEYREGNGMILFCQLDVTGRTGADPAAVSLTHNLLKYVANWKPSPRRTALYVGDREGREHFEHAGVDLRPYEGGSPLRDHVLIAGPGSGKVLARDHEAISTWLQKGGHLLSIGLRELDVRASAPLQVRTEDAEHIAAYFEPPSFRSLLAGIGPADVHNRDPRRLPLVAGGASVLGDGVLAKVEEVNVVFCQLAPWQFGGSDQPNHRKTFRRSSFLAARLLANMGVAASTPVTSRFRDPVRPSETEKRWQTGLYADLPQEWDDPYRFFRW